MSRATQEGPDLRVPLYHQVYLQLRERIASGALAPGGKVPTEAELSLEFGVSRITVSRALGELASEGMIVRSRGSGTRVAQSLATREEPLVSTVEQLVEQLHRMGSETSVQLLSCEMVPAPYWVSKALSVPEGANVQQAVRVRNLESGPFSHLTTFVPKRIASTFQPRELAEHSLIHLMERAGVLLGRARQTISATLADVQVAPLLKVSAGSPLLRITRTVYDIADEPVEHLTALYNPDRFQYQVSLERVRSGEEARWSVL